MYSVKKGRIARSFVKTRKSAQKSTKKDGMK